MIPVLWFECQDKLVFKHATLNSWKKIPVSKIKMAELLVLYGQEDLVPESAKFAYREKLATAKQVGRLVLNSGDSWAAVAPLPKCPQRPVLQGYGQ